MDKSLFQRVNRFAVHSTWLHGAATAYAKYGVALFAVLLVVAWLRARAAADIAAEVGLGWTGLATLIALGLGQLLGGIVNRARPYEAIPNVEVLVSRTTDFSFPSDHALTVGAIAAGLWLVNRNVGRVAVLAAILMAAARVYVGVHYPGDVAAGLLIGALVVLAGRKPTRRPLKRLLELLNRLPGIPFLTGT